MKLLVNGVDLIASKNVAIDTISPVDDDLSRDIGILTFVVDEDVATTPQVPDNGLEVLFYDDDGTTLLFGGVIRDAELVPHPIKRRWVCSCQDYNVRLVETTTGSLTYLSVTSDRDIVIGILRDALKAQSFGNGSGIDDAIITANEPNWPNVQATSFVAGLDLSYMAPSAALNILRKSVPNVYLRIRPDKTVRYGIFRDKAPFALHSSPNGTTLVAFEGYREREIVADHRNKMRRGGIGAAEATATDEVSFARFGRIFDDPYKNDENIPAGSIKQFAYAELRSRRVKRVASARVRTSGLKVGQIVPVVAERLGRGPGHMGGTAARARSSIDTTETLDGRSVSGQLAHCRGSFLITRVAQTPIGAGAQVWDIALGDPVTDFATQIAKLAGA